MTIILGMSMITVGESIMPLKELQGEMREVLENRGFEGYSIFFWDYMQECQNVAYQKWTKHFNREYIPEILSPLKIYRFGSAQAYAYEAEMPLRNKGNLDALAQTTAQAADAYCKQIEYVADSAAAAYATKLSVKVWIEILNFSVELNIINKKYGFVMHDIGCIIHYIYYMRSSVQNIILIEHKYSKVSSYESFGDIERYLENVSSTHEARKNSSRTPEQAINCQQGNESQEFSFAIRLSSTADNRHYINIILMITCKRCFCRW